MKSSRPFFHFLLLILLTSSFAVAGKHTVTLRRPVFDRIAQVPAGHYGISSAPLRNATSGTTSNEEKRHRKTLVSEAIVADFSVPSPQFSYCSRSYSLFLPGGCLCRPLDHSYLRGPPFCC